MPAYKGRNLGFLWNNAAVLGVREKGLTLNGEPIDVTSDEDLGWRTLLANLSAEDQVEIAISGVSKDQILKTDWFAGNRTRTARLTWPDGSQMNGTFFLANYSETGTYNDAATFEGTLQSSGVVTFTPV